MTAREKLMFRVDEEQAARLRYFAAAMGFQTDSDALRALLPEPWQADLVVELGRWYKNGKAATESFWDFIAFAAQKYMIENGALHVHPLQARQQTTEATIRLFIGALRASRGEPGFRLVPFAPEPEYNLVEVDGEPDLNITAELKPRQE